MNLTESLVLLAASVGLLFFIRGRDGESHRILRKFSLGSGPNGRHDRIVAVRWRPHGHRDKSELAALEIFCFAIPRSAPGSRTAWALPVSPTCLPNGQGSARCSAFRRTDSAFEPSLYQRQSPPSGNAIVQGRDKDPETAPATQ
jgi:hypothetical protein